MRRHVGTPEARAANLRRVERAVGEAGRRIRNGALAGGTAAAGVAGYGLAVGGIEVVGMLLAIPAVVAVGAAALFIPTRRAKPSAKLATLPPAEAVAQAESWLAARRSRLPSRAGRPLDAVCAGLHTVGSQLARAAAGDAAALDAQRLAAVHLPRLVDSYLAVPEPHRPAGSEVERELIDGLKVIGDELGRLSRTLAAEQVDAVKIEGRFLEQRYGETADGPR